MTVLLKGSLKDITATPIEEITDVTVKAPAFTFGEGGAITTSQPKNVDVADDGSFSLSVEEGKGWLYLSGAGWSDSIGFVASSGMSYFVEAVANFDATPIYRMMRELIDLMGGDTEQDLQKLVEQAKYWAEIAKNAEALGQVWYKGNVPTSADLDTFTAPGEYSAPSWSVIKTLKNFPAGLPGDFSHPATLSVLNSGERIVQVWKTIPPQGNASQVAERFYTGGAWSPWMQKPTSITKLKSGDNLDTWGSPGAFEAPSFTVAASLVGRPSAISGAVGAAIFTHAETPSGHKRQTWDKVVGPGQESFRLFRSKGASAPEWGEWKREAEFIEGATPTGSWSRTGVIEIWGDSGVAAGIYKDIAGAVANTVTGLGEWGWTSDAVLVKSGAIKISGTPTTGVIPASGSVDIDTHGQDIGEYGWRAWDGTFAGIPGKLHREVDGKWRFERSTPGDKKPVTTLTPFISASATTGVNTMIFTMGGNDVLGETGFTPESDKAAHIVANYARAVENATVRGVKHILISGVKTRAATQPGDENHQLVQKVNAQLAHLFPQYFVSRHDWLVKNGLRAAGLTPTEEETQLMQAGVIPPRVMADHTHVKREVEAVEARELWATQLKARGWAQ